MNTKQVGADALQELLNRLPRYGSVKITVAFPGEYWVSYNDKELEFLPGTGSYDILEVAALRALRFMDYVEQRKANSVGDSGQRPEAP